jgi:hypothetical protein
MPLASGLSICPYRGAKEWVIPAVFSGVDVMSRLPKRWGVAAILVVSPTGCMHESTM